VENYSQNQVLVANGICTFTADKINGTYYSGGIQNPNSRTISYGYYEARINLPQFTGGQWPAFWMPGCDGNWHPELDIVDGTQWGNTCYWTGVHWVDGSGGSDQQNASKACPGGSITGGFHTYGLLWTKDSLIWYFDDTRQRALSTSGMNVTNCPNPIILNLEMGGWGGGTINDGTFPWVMQTDWVRVWQIDTSPITRSAYNGPHKIPGRTEAEDYDNGGEGVAYHDSDAVNSLGQYRQDGVDIKTTGDTQGGGFDVGRTSDGEWLEYTMDSVKADKYDINLRCGSAVDGAQVRVKLDGATLGTITVPNLGNWYDKQTVTIAGVTLTAGTKKVLRLEIVGGGADINWIEFVKSQATGVGLAGRHVTAMKPEMVEILSLDGRVAARVPAINGRTIGQSAFHLGAGIYFIRRNGQTDSGRRLIIVNK
jgi:hypothetical protein